MSERELKVLGIAGSPRRGGNTDLLLDEAMKGAVSKGARVKTVVLSQLSISPCQHCDACLEAGRCKIKDDMQTVYQQLELADGVILGTPVYFVNVSAQAKAVMDRTYALLGVRGLRGKVAAALVVARRVGAGQVLSLLYAYFTAQRMIISGGGVGYGREKGEVKEGVGGSPNLSALQEARAVGRNVVWMVERFSKGKN